MDDYNNYNNGEPGDQNGQYKSYDGTPDGQYQQDYNDYQNGQYQQNYNDNQSGQYQDNYNTYQNDQYQQSYSGYQDDQYQQNYSNNQNGQYQQNYGSYQGGQYQQSYEGQGAQFIPGGPGTGNNYPQFMTYLILSILMCCCCNPLFGIIAFIIVMIGNGNFKKGLEFEGNFKAAKIVLIIGLVLALLGMVVSIASNSIAPVLENMRI